MADGKVDLTALGRSQLIECIRKLEHDLELAQDDLRAAQAAGCNESLHILQHALGLDDYGRDSRGHVPADVGATYRNYYALGPDCDGWDLCMAHVEAGRMTKHDRNKNWTGGMSCFCVTDAGLAFIREHSPRPPKQTRAQKRYEAYLDADSALSFGEWLKAQRGAAHGR